MHHRTWACAAMIALLTAAADGRAEEPADMQFGLRDPSFVTLGAGAWEAFRNSQRAGEVDLLLRPAVHAWVIKPQIGVTFAGDGDALLYAGPLIDYYLSPHWVATVSASVAVWTGSGINLGSRVEFRSGGGLAWRWDDASRLGVAAYHTSNASLSTRDPGSESLVVEYSLPINLGL